jgi:hypothetical protein
MKLLFLDIDGVLNSTKFFNRIRSFIQIIDEDDYLDPEPIKIINELIEETDAKVIISSSWRLIHSLEKINFLLQKHGAIFSAVDVTPELTNNNQWGKRGLEIQAYLDSLKKKPESICIIDDNNDIKPLEKYLILTTFKDGLTKDHKDLCLEKLNQDYVHKI